MNDDFVLKFGKHVGKTLGWVKENHPSYIIWAKENAPNLFKESKPVTQKPITQTETPKRQTPIPFNENFLNEGPDEISKPYLNKNK